MTSDNQAADAVAELKALGPDGRLARSDLPYAEVLRRATDYLGPFESLPRNLQLHLIRLYREDEELRTLARGAVSYGLAYSGALLSRALYGAERLAARVESRTAAPWNGTAARARTLLRRTARQSARVPFLLRRWVRHFGALLRLRFGRCDLLTLLQADGFDPRPLGFEYLQGLQQIRGCESVLKRAHSQVTHSLLVGLDFVKSGGTYWFLEANWNPSLMDERLALYEPDRDPWVNNVLAAATARGFRRVVVYGYRPFSPGHAAALVAAGTRLGVRVEIVDDLFSRPHAAHARALWMENGAAHDAFVVRAKGYDVLFDRAILSKRQTRRIVETAGIDWPAAGAALPRLIPPGAEAANYRPDSRYPNIVAKRDGLDRGAGVSFYKLPQVPEALRREADYFEEYQVPDPCPCKIVRGEPVPLTDGTERAWKIRSFALLTPEGVDYLSSIKVISGLQVPPQLPDGKVARKNIYLVTVNEGGFYSAVSETEDAEFRRVSNALGGALLQWLQRKYSADDAVH